MLKTLFLLAAGAAAAIARPQAVLPPGVPEACRYTYPICSSVPLQTYQDELNYVHNNNVILEQLKAQQLQVQAAAPYVPIVGPSGVVRQGEIIGASNEVVYTK